MSLLFKCTLRSSALIAAAALAACGGGGGSSSSSTNTTAQTVAITQSNYTNYATPMGESVVGMNGSSAATGSFGGTGTGASAARVLAWVQQARLASRAVAMSATAHAQATGSISDTCPFGGSMTGTANYANASTITKGDSASVTFSNCIEESGGAPLNGGMSLTFNAYSANPVLLDVSGSFTNFSAGTPALDGGFQMTLAQTGTADTLEMSFSGMKIGSDPTTYDTTLDATVASSGGSVSFSLGGSVTTTDGHYTLTQVTPFTSNGGDPVSGVLRLSDPQGNAVQMTANADGSVVFAYYPSGATAPTATSSTYSWAQFKQ